MGASASTTSLHNASANSSAVALNAYKMFRKVRVEFEIKTGDMLEVQRGLTCHWMLYIGNDEVVHISVDAAALISCCAGLFITDALVPTIDDNGKICKGIVTVSKIYDVIKDTDLIRKNNKEDLATKANVAPFSVEETVKRALEMRGKEVDYQLQEKNCEYYVTSWKYENAQKILSAACEDDIGTRVGKFFIDGLAKVGKLTNASMTTASANSGAVAVKAYKMLREIRFEFRKGDMLEVQRGLICHWMLYIGNDEVVHISVDPSIALICCCAGLVITDALIPTIHASGMCQIMCKGIVIVSKIYDVIKDTDLVRKNNKEDLATKANVEPFSVEETVKRALEMKGKEVDYQLEGKNCEHYVTSWKYANAEKLFSAPCEDDIGTRVGKFAVDGLVKVGKLIH